MKIDEYIQRHELFLGIAMVPPSLRRQFNKEDDIAYVGNRDVSCVVGICRKHGFFAVWRAKGITNGKVGKDYPTLDNW